MEQDDIWICECVKMSEGQWEEWEKSREAKNPQNFRGVVHGEAAEKYWKKMPKHGGQSNSIRIYTMNEFWGLMYNMVTTINCS